MFSCTLQIWISLGQHSLELLTFILFANFVVFACRHLTVVSSCIPLPQSCRHRSWFQQAGDTRSLCSTKWFWVFVSGGVHLILRGLLFVIGCFAVKCGLVILPVILQYTWVRGPWWPPGPCIYACVGVYLGSGGKIALYSLPSNLP